MAHPAIPIRDLVGTRVSRFIIISRLGRGGMGEVFLGEDTLLKRHVAMKVIRREHSVDTQFRERLLKEAERASQLNNDHIARIYDVVEQDERIFLIMEYVEGRTLRERMDEALSSEQFFAIAQECLSGLAAAHSHGILHCDLKPENLMLTTSGAIKILDFGLARHVQTPETRETVTLAGGTPGYIAPEVLMGRTPDCQADIYSLGVVFHELINGRRPFSPGPMLRDAVHRGAVPSSGARALTLGLTHVITRMLAADPAQRYGSCQAVLDDLTTIRSGRTLESVKTRTISGKWWIMMVAVAALAALIAVLIYISPWPTAWSSQPVSASTRELVILPFQPADANDPSSRAFADGLSETLSAKLGEISDRYSLQVVPAAEVRAQKVMDAQHARSLLGASMALHGSMQRDGNTVRVSYSLVDTSSLRQMNSGVVTADAGNAFAVQDRVIQEVLGNLNIELAKTDRTRMLTHSTSQPKAYELYLRGRGYLQQYDRKENVENAIAAFQQSVQADPRFALAYAGLGQAYVQMYGLTHATESLSNAEDACRRSANIDSDSVDAELCLGMIFNRTGKYQEATQHLERAVKLDPSRDEPYRELSTVYEHLKQVEDAEAVLRKAIAVRPQYWAGYNWLGWFYWSHGRYDDAIAQFKRVVQLAPDSISGYSNLGAMYVVKGDLASAIAALEKSISIQPTASALSNLGALYFYEHRYLPAAQAYSRAADLNPNQYVVYGNLAEAYAQIPGKQGDSRMNYAEALSLAEEQLRVNPEQGVVRIDAALYAVMLGQKDKALAYRNLALKLSAEDPQAWHRSALVLAQLHRDKAALADLRKAVKAGLSPSEITSSPAWQRFAADPGFREIIENSKRSYPGKH